MILVVEASSVVCASWLLQQLWLIVTQMSCQVAISMISRGCLLDVGTSFGQKIITSIGCSYVSSNLTCIHTSCWLLSHPHRNLVWIWTWAIDSACRSCGHCLRLVLLLEQCERILCLSRRLWLAISTTSCSSSRAVHIRDWWTCVDAALFVMDNLPHWFWAHSSLMCWPLHLNNCNLVFVNKIDLVETSMHVHFRLMSVSLTIFIASWRW